MWEDLLENAAKYAVDTVDLTTSYQALGFISAIDFLCSARVAHAHRLEVTHPVFWAKSLAIVGLTHLGGTTVASVLLGEAPGWTRRSGAPAGVLFAWWAMFFFPGDLFFRFYRFRLVQLVALLVECVNSAYAIVYLGIWRAAHIGESSKYGVNRKFDGAETPLATVLLCGVVAGVGGGLLLDFLDLHIRPMRHRRRLPIAQSRSFGRAILCALVALVLLDPRRMLWDRPVVEDPMVCVTIVAFLQIVLRAFPDHVVDTLGNLVSRLIFVRAIFVPANAGKDAAQDRKAARKLVESTLTKLRSIPSSSSIRSEGAKDKESSTILVDGAEFGAFWDSVATQEKLDHATFFSESESPKPFSPTLPPRSSTPDTSNSSTSQDTTSTASPSLRKRTRSKSRKRPRK